MVNTAAKIELVEPPENGMTFAAVATAKNGNIWIRRQLTSGFVANWQKAVGYFDATLATLDTENSVTLRYPVRHDRAARLAGRLIDDYLEKAEFPHTTTYQTDRNKNYKLLTVQSKLYTATVRVGEEVAMDNYRVINTCDLVGSGLYVAFNAIAAYGASQIRSIQCSEHPPEPLSHTVTLAKLT